MGQPNNPDPAAGPAFERLRLSLDRRRDLVLDLEPILPDVARAAARLAAVFGNGARALLFGNGGSHAQAVHLEAELVGRFASSGRSPLPALVLPGSEATLTALCNDFGFELALERSLRAHARPGDAAIAFSTSGRSANVTSALRLAREIGLATIAFTGRAGGDLAPFADVAIRVRSEETAVIQEGHLLLTHLLVEAVEAELGYAK